MSYLVYGGEKKLQELVSRAYGELKPADAARAEAAIRAANPRLANLRTLKEGAIVVVPALPGLKRADAAPEGDPARGLLATLATSLEQYAAQVQASARAEVEAITEESRLLKAAGIAAAQKESPEIAPYVKQAAAAWDGRAKQAEESAMLAKRVLPEAREALATMAKLLGRV